jgi:hypothetical protein
MRALLTARSQAGDSLMLVMSLNRGERVCPLKAAGYPAALLFFSHDGSVLNSVCAGAGEPA